MVAKAYATRPVYIKRSTSHFFAPVDSIFFSAGFRTADRQEIWLILTLKKNKCIYWKVQCDGFDIVISTTKTNRYLLFAFNRVNILVGIHVVVIVN